MILKMHRCNMILMALFIAMVTIVTSLLEVTPPQSPTTGTSTSHGASLEFHPAILQSITDLQQRFQQVDLRTMKNLDKILQLYRSETVDASAFHGVNGYGYGDIGREKFDNVVAKLMGAEAAMVRLQFFSGTHAISKALFTCLRPGDKLLGVSGKPYDTLEEVIGLRPASNTGTFAGSLRDWGVSYGEIDLLISEYSDQSNIPVAKFNLDAIADALDNDPSIKVIHIQRSCGYQWRPSIPIKEIKRLCEFINSQYKAKGRDELIIFCDNCYGELVEDQEPCHVGVDLVAGSLIKNLGGTLAPCGGYIAGKQALVQSAANHLAAPGVEGGATFNMYRTLFQGLWLAPTVVGESIKGAELLSHTMGKGLGYECNPPPGSHRTDIIQAVKLNDRKKVS